MLKLLQYTLVPLILLFLTAPDVSERKILVEPAPLVKETGLLSPLFESTSIQKEVLEKPAQTYILKTPFDNRTFSDRSRNFTCQAFDTSRIYRIQEQTEVPVIPRWEHLMLRNPSFSSVIKKNTFSQENLSYKDIQKRLTYFTTYMDTTNTIVGLLDKEISELHMLTMAAWDAFDAIKSPLENELQYIAKTAHTAWQDGNLVAADCVRERLLYMAKQNVHTCTLPIDHFTEGTYYKAFDVGRWVTSYLQIRNTITDTTQKNVLQQWFKNLLDCQEDFTQQLLHQSNQLKEPIWNGIYSAMRVSALLGVALESREILLQAVDTLVLVMGSIQDTGTMRNEIETKKESALFYHNSMANDTMAIVAIAEYNEIELLDDENIYTFLTTVVDNLDDGALFESLTGHKQTREISIGTLFWVRYYLDVIDGNKKSALPQYIQNFIQTIDRAYMTREFWY